MKSNIFAFDQMQFFAFAQKISKSNLINKSILPQKNSTIQNSKNSNLLYSEILPNKERSKSVNAIMSSILKQGKVNYHKEIKTINKQNENLELNNYIIDNNNIKINNNNKDFNNNEGNFSINNDIINENNLSINDNRNNLSFYDLNYSNEQNYYNDYQNNRNKSLTQRQGYHSYNNNINKKDIHSIKNFLFLTRNLGGKKKIKKKILNTEEHFDNKTNPSINSFTNNTINDNNLNYINKNNNTDNNFTDNICANINENNINGNIVLDINEINNNDLNSRSIPHFTNVNNHSYYSFKSTKVNNNIFRRNSQIKEFNSVNSLNNSKMNNFNKSKNYVPKIKFIDNLFEIPKNQSFKNLNLNLNNIHNNLPYKNDNFEDIENINPNTNINSNYNILTSKNTPSSILEKKNNNTYNNTYNNRISTNNKTNPNIFPKNYITNNNLLNQKKESIIIELEDLIVLEEKLYYIKKSFNEKKSHHKICIEWWNFYIYTSFGGNFELFFKNDENKTNFQIAHETSILELISIIITYEILKDSELNQSISFLLIDLLNEVHQNFLIICDYILSIIKDKISKKNIWVNKLQNIIALKLNNSINSNEHILLLTKGNCTINSIIKNILKKEKNENLTFIKEQYYRKIKETTIQKLNDYFKNKIKEDYLKKGENFSFIIPENNPNSIIKIPYLENKIKNNKIFTLVLDLDDTLINFKYDSLGRGILKLRPNLHNFLDEMCKIFEIIIFTAATKDYADPILDIIENKKKYFDMRLYRQHTILMNNVLVKDLSKLGRDLSKTIIIDNMPQNFKLQKENGIFIQSYDGENKNDSKLVCLCNILKYVTRNFNCDVREELRKVKKEIFSQITTDLKFEDD